MQWKGSINAFQFFVPITVAFQIYVSIGIATAASVAQPHVVAAKCQLEAQHVGHVPGLDLPVAEVTVTALHNPKDGVIVDIGHHQDGLSNRP